MSYEGRSTGETDLTLPDVAALAKGGAVILTRRGKPLAAVKEEQGGISLAEVRRELRLKAARPSSRRKKK